ncbi:aldehyde dehydrogenase family protein [Blastococcus mobilis]|uniref:Acyl-CoA reductase n=1 Tax=Blastococcus mobilis TaxID=1938746 RepID=A0A238YFG5_9ACTN|nr:aldehyde dehydrogenase family protein [Blastococcus mobilis]SNR69481.1 Acyl-CoA reductase [Blastococcus mobilis]
MSLEQWHRDAVYVGGRWQQPQDRRTVGVENPATEEIVGRSAEAGGAEVDDAVAAATAAFPAWAAMGTAGRVAVLRRWLDVLRAQRELLVETTIAEVGAPRTTAEESHVDTALDVLEGYLTAAGEVAWEEEAGHSLVLREPIGVVGCITPWNYPLYQVLAKVGGALVAGCTVVLKPAEITPMSAYLLADAASVVGLPAGVFNLVPGSGRVVGEALVTHPGVDMVSFTGSTGVGARVSGLAAPTVKRVALELGGKSASVVLPDADLHTAVAGTVAAAMLNSGQTCSAWSRLLVPTDRLDEAVDVAVAAVERLVVGDPTATGTDMGPVVSAAQRKTVLGFLSRAVEGGAVLASGSPDRPAGLDRGHYVMPTVVTGLLPGAEIVREEVFGPVLTVQGYRDEADAVAMANATDYGLSGAVWSGSDEKALAIARRMRTGQVDINGAAFNPMAPFGGYRRSGNGRELGKWGIEEFLETKSVQR